MNIFFGSINLKTSVAYKSKLLFLMAVLSVISFVGLQAQQYPVQGSLIVASPYPSYISDYANPSMEKLILNLICTDINLVNQRVRLKLSIYKSSSLMAKSTEVVINEPMVTLDGGVPLRLTSVELANYFKLENLQGIAPNAYSQTLPEGAYTVTFQVFDYFTGNKLSGDISQQFWLLLNDPPFLNSPADKENILQSSSINPQIAFQWTPRTTQVSNTEYTFQLAELWDDNGDPYLQFLAGPPKYTTTTTNTTLLYGITEPPLIPGRRYAWRVQAKAKQGLDDIGLYRNNGYSNIYTFKYAGQCDAIESVNGEVKASDRIYLEWQPPSIHQPSLITQHFFKVAYRKYSPSNQWEWAELPTTNGFINLTNLDGNTEYEIKVGNVCDNNLVGYSPPIRLRTKETGSDIPANCGQAPVVDLSNKNLIQKLSAYEVVTATDFPITLTKVEGNANGWSGEGWVKVSYLGDAKIHVVFSGIKVNTDYKLIDGYFETTYNPKGSETYDVGQTISNVKGIVEDIGELIKGVDKLKTLLQKPQENKTEIDQWVKTYEPQLYEAIEKSALSIEQKAAYKNEIKDLIAQTVTASNNEPDEKAIAAAGKVAQRLEEIKTQTERIDKQIDYDKLVRWLKDNKGKGVAYSIKNFLKDEKISLGLGNGATVSLSKAYQYTVNGVSKTLQLTGSLSTDEGNVTLTAENTLLPVAVDFKTDKIIFNEDNYFDDKPKGDINSVAIRLTTNSFNDLDYLLQLQEYKHGEPAQDYYKAVFNKAFETAGSDCDKIDVLYQEMPPFVASARNDDDKWKDLVSLLNCRIDETGTNENKAVINLLNGFDPAFLFNKAQSEKDILKELASKMSNDYLPLFGIALTKAGAEKWTEM